MNAVRVSRTHGVARGGGGGETDLLAEALDQLSWVLAREAGTGGGDEQRPVCASGDGLLHGVCDGGVQWCDCGLGGLGFPKELWTEREGGTPPEFTFPRDEREQACVVCERVMASREEGTELGGRRRYSMAIVS